MKEFVKKLLKLKKRSVSSDTVSHTKFKTILKLWRGKRERKVVAIELEIPYSTYRSYENGKRTPSNLARIELERRMEAHK